MKIPEPKPALVIRYSFLWKWEQEKGQEEGSKKRPVVIMSVVPKADGFTRVAVLPITSKVGDPSSRIEIPENARKRLGLDADSSWISFTDLNEFVWPGYDLELAHPESEGPEFGFLSGKFFDKVVMQFIQAVKSGTIERIPRE